MTIMLISAGRRVRRDDGHDASTPTRHRQPSRRTRGVVVRRSDTKSCLNCGRTITWRKKWARDWVQVKFCSASCRGKLSSTDIALERAILTLLASRSSDASICPSEAARVVDPENWTKLMEPTRRAARRLVTQGKLQIMQRGRVVDPSTARGPIRLRRPQ